MSTIYENVILPTGAGQDRSRTYSNRAGKVQGDNAHNTYNTGQVTISFVHQATGTNDYIQVQGLGGGIFPANSRLLAFRTGMNTAPFFNIPITLATHDIDMGNNDAAYEDVFVVIQSGSGARLWTFMDIQRVNGNDAFCNRNKLSFNNGSPNQVIGANGAVTPSVGPPVAVQIRTSGGVILGNTVSDGNGAFTCDLNVLPAPDDRANGGAYQIWVNGVFVCNWAVGRGADGDNIHVVQNSITAYTTVSSAGVTSGQSHLAFK